MKFQLKHQLTLSQQESERNLSKFRRFAERADIGIFLIGMDGVYSYRNEAWFEMLGPVDPSIDLADAWGKIIDDEFIEMGKSKFEELIKTKQHQ